jgi:hypothetical protein
MTEIFIDYSAAELSGAAVASASYNGTKVTGAIRYVDDPRLAKTKHTTPAEYADLVAHGIKVRLVFEVGTNDSAGGRAAGVAYAQRALAGANSLGYTGVIYFCNDQTTLASVANWQAYLDGAASVLGIARVGAYGFRNAIDAAQGHASAFWQCGAQSALRAGVNMYQWNNGSMPISGITCDINYVYNDYQPGVEDMAFNYDDQITVGPPFTTPPTVKKIGDVINDVRNASTGIQAQVTALSAKVDALATQPAPVIDYAQLAAAFITALAAK